MSEIKPKMNLLLPGDYCNDCPYFKPIVSNDAIYADGVVIAESIRYILCENEDLCNNIHDYLKQAFGNKGKVEKTCENCEHNFPGSPYCIGCQNRSHWRKIDE